MNILITDPYEFYRHGLQHFFIDTFYGYISENIFFLTDYDPLSFYQADVTVLTLSPGEHFMCIPELRARQKGIVIGLVDESLEINSILPLCFSDMIIIHRRESLDEIKNKILSAWQKAPQQKIPWCKDFCMSCHRKDFTIRQGMIMSFIYQGMLQSEIAKKLTIAEKTVSTHKCLIMKKFKLRTDRDLIHFLRKLAGKNVLPVFPANI